MDSSPDAVNQQDTIKSSLFSANEQICGAMHAVEKLGGNVVAHCEMPDIAYHAFLVNIPTKSVEPFLSDVDTFFQFELFRYPKIMKIYTVGMCSGQTAF